MLACWGRHGVCGGGQVVQAFLDQQANDAVRVEDEVTAVCVAIPDLTTMDILLVVKVRMCEHDWDAWAQYAREQGDELWCLRQDGHILLRGLFRHRCLGLLGVRSIVGPYRLCRSFLGRHVEISAG